MRRGNPASHGFMSERLYHSVYQNVTNFVVMVVKPVWNDDIRKLGDPWSDQINRRRSCSGDLNDLLMFLICFLSLLSLSRMSSTPSATTVDLFRESSSSGRTASRPWWNILPALKNRCREICRCNIMYSKVIGFPLICRWLFIYKVVSNLKPKWTESISAAAWFHFSLISLTRRNPQCSACTGYQFEEKWRQTWMKTTAWPSSTVFVFFARRKPEQHVASLTVITFDSVQSAQRAKASLNGADIYSGCCTLKIEYAKVRLRSPQTGA